VAFCEAISIPFARLRTALPIELLPGVVAHCTGVQAGPGAKGLEASAADLHAAMSRVGRSFRTLHCCAGIGRNATRAMPDFQMGEEEPSTPTSKAELMAQEMVGTALAMAHLHNRRAMRPAELEAQRAACERHFEGVRAPGCDMDYNALQAHFMVMIGGACACALLLCC